MSKTTISSGKASCSRHRWEGPDRYGIAARGFASSYVMSTWALDGSREM